MSKDNSTMLAVCNSKGLQHNVVTQAGRNQSKDNRYVCIVLSFLVD